MTLTLNPTSSIRPLGEEHLKMFRRMTQGREVVPRITLPKEALQRPKFTLTGIIVNRLDEAGTIARKHEGRLPTLREIESIIHDPTKQYSYGRLFWSFCGAYDGFHSYTAGSEIPSEVIVVNGDNDLLKRLMKEMGVIE